MKKMLLAGCLLASVVGTNASSTERAALLGGDRNWSSSNMTQMVETNERAALLVSDQDWSSSSATKMVKTKTRKGISTLNSLLSKGVYGVGRTIKVAGTVLDHTGWAIAALGGTYISFEQAAMSKITRALTDGMAAPGALGLKEIATTVEARGARSSYIGRAMRATILLGVTTKFVAKGLRWFGSKICDYAKAM